ncbi:MAG: PIN domain-containing protein, partial [Saprospiraceae bacterium]
MPKIFVLDTSVLLFDHNALSNFQDNDIVIPITVLEELDNFKIGNDTKNFEAREVIRYLDKLSENKNLHEWINRGAKQGKIKIYNGNNKELEVNAESVYGGAKNDHKILNVALILSKEQKKSKVVLVTKDINLRIKAKALGIDADDYRTGKVEDMDNVSEGSFSLDNLDARIIQEIYAKSFIRENNILKGNKIANGYYVLNNCTQSALVRYDESSDCIFKVEKNYAYGIKPKNAEQTFAIDALL